MRGCYFTGAALHTNVAGTLQAHAARLHESQGGVGQVTAEYAGKAQTLPYRLLADAPLGPLDQRLDAVLDELIDDAIVRAELSPADRRRMGLFLGSSSFDIGATEHQYAAALKNDAGALAMARSSSIGNLALQICERFRLRGPDYSFNTACTASANALVYADAMIRNGELDHALVLAVETYNSITALGFSGLQLLTPTAMRPFSPERNGLVLGEGCSALVLSHRAPRPDAFRLIGSGNLCDTHSMSAANPDGSTVAFVIEQALRSAHLQAADITALKTHGTASLLNDEAEAAGMRRVFARMPPLTGLKPHLGHTLGACGLNELLAFCAAAERGFLIATPGVGIGDDKLGVELNQRPLDVPRGHFMLNYFGFGGNNTSLIVSNLPEQTR
jgi:3-oxoacyl-(acyl-carrier-protein) synthase